MSPATIDYNNKGHTLYSDLCRWRGMNGHLSSLTFTKVKHYRDIFSGTSTGPKLQTTH